MKKNYYFIIIALLASLFIYLFYRTEKTVINEMLISVISLDKYTMLRNAITSNLPLHNHIIYSLPEGLWVFSITITSKLLFIRIGTHTINLVFLPLIFSIGLELFQLLHLTNGRFDLWDIGFSILFWAIANYLMKHEPTRQNIIAPFTIKSSICLLSYVIVYLAHVWQ